jgi:hypothetical protein
MVQRACLTLSIALLAALHAAAPSLAADANADANKGRPNILFIFCDDHAYQALSAYGHGLNQTPNLDRIAKQGMLFENCFVTNSLCGPSRAVVQTGKYSHLNGYYGNAGIEKFSADHAQAHAEGRLPDRRRRQVAPGHRPPGLRLLAHPSRPGPVL